MEDGKGLELSLGLSCPGSSSNSKEKSSNSADVKTDTDERTSKILNDFKNFLNAGISQPQETFFNNLSHTENGPTSGDKRKNMLNETANQKRQETETRSSDLQDKGKTSHISITTTDEGSTADNEDVADSSQSNPSKVSKEVCGKVNVSGPHFRAQSVSNVSVPFSITFKESQAGISSTSYQISNTMHAIPATKGECPRTLSASPGNVPMSFGYSPIQITPRSHHSPYSGGALSTSEPIRVDGPTSDQSKPQTKHAVPEEGSSSHSEDDKVRPNSFPSEYPSIRPGIAADVKFGGSGSFPNLPWVSTTGPGPNGKTISGVTYKYNATQIKIVCACHGIHMSPDEFVRHANEDPSSSPSMTPGLVSISSSNPAASAKS